MSPSRGEVILIRSSGSEPYQAVGRPAVVVQNDAIDADAYDSILVCLITGSSTCGGVCRIELSASSETGLAKPSEIMVDKLTAIARARVGEVIGRADATTLRKVERALLLLLDLA